MRSVESLTRGARMSLSMLSSSSFSLLVHALLLLPTAPWPLRRALAARFAAAPDRARATRSSTAPGRTRVARSGAAPSHALAARSTPAPRRRARRPLHPGSPAVRSPPARPWLLGRELAACIAPAPRPRARRSRRPHLGASLLGGGRSRSVAASGRRPLPLRRRMWEEEEEPRRWEEAAAAQLAIRGRAREEPVTARRMWVEAVPSIWWYWENPHGHIYTCYLILGSTQFS